MYDHMETPAMTVPHAPHEGITLPQHEANSAHRAAHIEHSIHKLKEHTMSISDREGINIFQRDGLGHSGGLGMGAGVGGFAGAALGSLLTGRRGLFGGGDGDGGGETRVESDIFNTAVLSKLGTIEAAVPLAEAQVQLALAGTQNALSTQAAINASAAALASAQETAAILSSAAATKDTVQNVGVVNLQATNQVGKEVIAAIGILSSKIDANTIANLQAELLESRSSGRHAATEVNVSQVVNQAQAQAQAQQQQQQQTVLLSQLVSGFGGFANQLNNVHQGIVQIGAGNSAIPTTTQTNVR